MVHQPLFVVSGSGGHPDDSGTVRKAGLDDLFELVWPVRAGTTRTHDSADEVPSEKATVLVKLCYDELVLVEAAELGRDD
jgi:hypothetical protein